MNRRFLKQIIAQILIVCYYSTVHSEWENGKIKHPAFTIVFVSVAITVFSFDDKKTSSFLLYGELIMLDQCQCMISVTDH